MSTHPFFSILVPTYNHAKYVGAALDSLLAQTDADWEAVVVNDGSTDKTAEVLNRYAQRDARIRVFHKPNGGTGSALNRALSEARGDWISWLSSDDFFDPKKLAIHRDWIRRDPTCRFHFTYFRLFDQAKGTTIEHPLWGPLPEAEFQVLGLFYRNYVSGISICVHRESWEKVGRFNERLRYAQDYDMWLRLLARYPATFIPEWTCINRHHSGQYSEIFPQACYYDTAAAGVQFLNDHRFEQMFPLLDLRDPDSALRAVERALTQAADDTAFLYWYGAHPNLLARTLEWAWDRSLGTEVHQQRAPCRQFARQMIADSARTLRGTRLGWHWQVAAAAMLLPDAEFTHTPIRPIDVGLGLLHDLRSQGKTDFEDLRRYFKMQYGAELPAAPPRSARRSVIVHDSEPTSATPMRGEALAQHLHATGCRTVLVARGPNRLRYVETIPFLEIRSTQVATQVLNELLPIDTVVWLDAAAAAHEIPAKQHYIIGGPFDSPSAEADRILGVAPAPPMHNAHPVGAHTSLRGKVVFVGARPWGGGAERVIHDLLHALDPDKLELHYVQLYNDAAAQVRFAPHIIMHDVELELKTLNVNRNPLRKRVLSRSSRILRALSDFLRKRLPPSEIKQHLNPYLDSIQKLWPHVIALKQIFHRIGPDALLIPVMEEAAIRVWLAQAFCSQPYCVSLHTTESKYMPVLYPNPDRLGIENFLLSSACRGAATVAIPSNGCKEDLVRHYDIPSDAVDVMPNPIDVRAIVMSCGDDPEIPLPALNGKTLFVHVARLSYAKNHRLLLDACCLLRGRYPNFLVACLGDGELRDEVQREINERGLSQHVLLLGEVKNPFAYMARAQGLVLTSRFESFALVLVEAMACGAAPISVDCPYGPREVLDEGKYGLLVPMDDPEALASAMHRTAEDRALRESLRQSGPKRARDFDLASLALQWEALIERNASAKTQLTLSAPTGRRNAPLRTSPDDRRKVVFIGRSPWGGGAERAIYDLIHGLDATKYDLHFIHLFDNTDAPVSFGSHVTVHSVQNELRAKGLSPYSLWRRGINRLSRYLRETSDWLRKGLPPVAMNQGLDAFLESTVLVWPQVIALNSIFNRIGSDALLIPVMEEAAVRVWLTQALTKRRYCVSLHIAESQYMPVLYPDPERLTIENFFLSSACRSADVIAIPSQGCKDDLSRYYNIPLAAIQVAPNSTNVDDVLNCSRLEPEVPLPALNGRCLFVHAARLSYQKNHRLLLEACSTLKKRTSDFVVACLGDGELRSEVQLGIDELGLQQNVLLVGEVKNPFAYMSRAQGLLLTSRFESFALVLVEAMACGAVPISVDCPHGPREVLDGGKYGLLTPNHDPTSLADAMHRVMAEPDLRNRFRSIGLQRARDYDLPTVVSQWEQIIDRFSHQSSESMTLLDSAA